jgi:hypothetical protein
MAKNTNYRQNFDALIRAFESRDVILLETWPTGEKPDGAFIFAVNWLPDGSRQLVPFAQMLDGALEPLVLPATPDTPPSPFGVN